MVAFEIDAAGRLTLWLPAELRGAQLGPLHLDADAQARLGIAPGELVTVRYEPEQPQRPLPGCRCCGFPRCVRS